MINNNLSIGSLVIPSISTQLFSAIFKTSADGDVFSPVHGIHVWEPSEMAIIIEIFEMPFNPKKLYKVLLSYGCVGWAWDDRLLSVYSESNHASA